MWRKRGFRVRRIRGACATYLKESFIGFVKKDYETDEKRLLKEILRSREGSLPFGGIGPIRQNRKSGFPDSAERGILRFRSNMCSKKLITSWANWSDRRSRVPIASRDADNRESKTIMSTSEADAKPSAEEAAGASSSAAAPASGGSSPHKLPLIITGTEEHGPFVPPKPEDIHDVKPALKKHPNIGVDADAMVADDAGADGDDEGGAGEDADAMEGNGGNRKKKAKKALKWDEHAIEEHDLLRGTRMKVGRYPKDMCYLFFFILPVGSLSSFCDDLTY